MVDFLERNLKKLADIQKKYTKLLTVIVIIMTITLGIGLKDLKVSSDVRKEMPLEMPIFKLNDRIANEFGGMDTVLIVAQIDESVDSKAAIRDIRDPRVIESFLFLDKSLQDEESVTTIASPASFFRGKRNETISREEVIQTLRKNPNAKIFFSNNYKMALMYVVADIGTAEDKIASFDNVIREKIGYTPKPPGIKFSITGTPIVRMNIFSLLKSDAVFTLTVSAIIILFLLFIMQRSFIHGFLVFIPLSLGLIWTMGTLGWLGVPLSVATVGLSSMILGLGVEYGVFVVTRYYEERAKKVGQLDSMKTTVHGIGTAIIGSGLTTIVGFGVLSFASIPMIQTLGQTLALGIAYCLLAALFANPVLILLEENYEYSRIQKTVDKIIAKRDELMSRGR